MRWGLIVLMVAACSGNGGGNEGDQPDGGLSAEPAHRWACSCDQTYRVNLSTKTIDGIDACSSEDPAELVADECATETSTCVCDCEQTKSATICVPCVSAEPDGC